MNKTPVYQAFSVLLVSKLCRQYNYISVIDNAFASPINQNPINLGIAYNNYLLKTDIKDLKGNEQHDALVKHGKLLLFFSIKSGSWFESGSGILLDEAR